MQIDKIVPLVSTDRLEAVKAFYLEHFEFETTFESEGYLGLRAAGEGGPELSFMRPEEGCASFGGAGLTCCLEVADVDAEHKRLGAAGLQVLRPLQDNPWGDRSFVVADPAGVALYIYKEIQPAEEFVQYFKA
jgi:predicted enzyme related to lactoylglutathione lyase